MEQSEDVRFRQMLLEVQESLRDDDLNDLMFLCSDHLTLRDLSTVSTATDLFTHLENQQKLSPDDPSLLLELLAIIKQHSLIRKLGLDECTETNGATYRFISPYRRMLFDLSQSICDEELKKIKFMLLRTLSRKKLKQDMTLLQLFSELEKKDLLDEDKVDNLQEIIKNVFPALEKRIIQYKTERENDIAQETENNASMSNIPVQTSLTPSLSSVDLQDEMDLLRLNEASGVSEDQSLRLDITSVTESESLNVSVTEHPEIPQYEMKGDRRGICVIFNNCNFSGSSHRMREGTEIDKESLKSVFQWLGFEVRIEQDCDRRRMLDVLKDLSRHDHTQEDCVVCCVLSHGDIDAIITTDGQRVTFRELMEPLCPPQCPSLIHKPKLFFIQACRGTEEQRAVWPQKNRVDEMLASDARMPRDSTAEAADFLLAMSTVPHYVSFREKDKGTWFIQALCDNMKLLVPSGVDLLTILTRVNHDVSRKSDCTGSRKQMPQPEFTLTKRVVFPIPQTHPPQ
ncbi:caspase-8 [Triplophysa dalaica]|uniref:caspase-8 n=1 Tax=Triplophysa dalaica TaxID=1582913 RepID=UPI0024E02B0B|nr:caspase-8 [Triplophysa dalaica]XP_056611862.1 caspase-8 [Triplophysa dalaica]